MLLWGSPVGAKIPVGFPAFLAITSVKIAPCLGHGFWFG
jgi:hypothetical protein